MFTTNVFSPSELNIKLSEVSNKLMEAKLSLIQVKECISSTTLQIEELSKKEYTDNLFVPFGQSWFYRMIGLRGDSVSSKAAKLLKAKRLSLFTFEGHLEELTCTAAKLVQKKTRLQSYLLASQTAIQDTAQPKEQSHLLTNATSRSKVLGRFGPFNL